jgi:hypothetical protein
VDLQLVTVRKKWTLKTGSGNLSLKEPPTTNHRELFLISCLLLRRAWYSSNAMHLCIVSDRHDDDLCVQSLPKVFVLSSLVLRERNDNSCRYSCIRMYWLYFRYYLYVEWGLESSICSCFVFRFGIEISFHNFLTLVFVTQSFNYT